MNDQIQKENAVEMWNFFSTRVKLFSAIAILIAGLQSSEAQGVYSPKGAELFNSSQAMVLPAKRVRLEWSYPSSQETPDLVFKIYHSTNLAQALQQWALLTNIPGNLRGADLIADKAQEFFVVTASNYLGESKMVPR